MFDSDNLPYHTNENGPDYGDTIHNVGRITVLKILNLSKPNVELKRAEIVNEYRLRMNHLMIGKLLRRSNKQWTDTNDITSDATEPIMLANLLLYENPRNQLIWNNLNENCWRFQNGKDIFRPHHLSVWGRHFDNHTWRLFGDLLLFLFVIYRNFIGSHLKNKEGNLDISEDINLILMVKVLLVREPTFLIRWADRIYTRKKFIWEYYFKGRSELGDYIWGLYK